MPPPKVKLFGTFLKIEPKIRKIIKFQNNTEIALADEIHRNLRQMKDLGRNFQKKLKKLIFDQFCIFYSIMNLEQIRNLEKVENIMICFIFQTKNREKYWFSQKNKKFIFFNSPNSREIQATFLISVLDLEINYFENFRFSDFRIFIKNVI